MTTATLRTTVAFDLASLMRAYKITIRELAARMDVTMTRVREVRGMGRVPYLVACDYHQSVTGANVFNMARWEAISKQAMVAAGIEIEDY